RYDHDFHSLIVGAARNSRLSEMYESLGVHILNLRMCWGRSVDWLRGAHEEHHHILKALRQRSSDVLTLLSNHIERSMRITLTSALAASESESGKDVRSETA